VRPFAEIVFPIGVLALSGVVCGVRVLSAVWGSCVTGIGTVMSSEILCFFDWYESLRSLNRQFLTPLTRATQVNKVLL